MKRQCVGLVTIGQSPRDDIVPDMLAQIGIDIDIVQRGAVDGLTHDEVRELAPQGDEPWAVSRLQDGTEVKLAKRELDSRMQRCVSELEHLGTDLIVPLCASDWSALRCRTSFINPGGALPAMVKSMLRPGGQLGVISPTAAQAELAHKRYADLGMQIESTFAQPYTTDADQQAQCERAAQTLAEAGVDLIYMSCMGHTQTMRDIVRRESGRPTITANGLIASLMRQILN
jgi:protein AroM